MSAKTVRRDLLSEAECRLWCRLVWSKELDLELQQFGRSAIDQFYKESPIPPLGGRQYGKWVEERLHHLEIPSWAFYELEEEGIDYIILSCLDYTYIDFPEWARFGLEEGIAPFQPFLVRLLPPEYITHHDGDHDVNYDFDVISIDPWPKSRVLWHWERYLKSEGLVVP